MKDKADTIQILAIDNINEVGIDCKERLYIKPEKQTFEYIWRAAAEVGWDDKEKILFSPKPREWSYHHWYRHIVAIAKDEYGCKLDLTEQTKWSNIPNDLKQQIVKT
jgi:hypothetical protein